MNDFDKRFRRKYIQEVQALNSMHDALTALADALPRTTNEYFALRVVYTDLYEGLLNIYKLQYERGLK